MTDWALNRLRFSGAREDIKLFATIGFALDDGSRYVLDFDAFVPMPADLRFLPRNKFGEPLEGAVAIRNWQIEHWGCRHIYEEFRFVRRDADFLEFMFSTPFNAPEGVYRAIARRFPRARVWAAAYQRGFKYGYRFEATDGKIEESSVEIDEALLRDVEGDAYPVPAFNIFGIGEEITREEFVTYVTNKQPKTTPIRDFARLIDKREDSQ